ncbi:transcription factor RelB isoform 2-T2 [Discoglossus pictus]
MREQEGTGSHDVTHDNAPTLDDVLEYIHSDSVTHHPPVLSSPSNMLDTVIVSPWNPPVGVQAPSWIPSQEDPTLRITEQPKQRGMRFRYQCEGRSAGSILGEHSTEHTKTLPEIELCHCRGLPEVRVTVCLVWKDPPHRVHPHSLVGKDCHDGICEVTLHPCQGEIKHSFSNLGIQCVKKREIEISVREKLRLNIDPFNAGLWRHHEEVDLNVVRLCFQASYPGTGTKRVFTSPILSEPVYDKKATNTSELRIYRMNREYGRCSGGDELYILCDKVQKEDIQVVFTDGTWEARADFSQADVHRQIAIVLKTPPYRDLDITEPAQVYVRLHRITDSIRSEGVAFKYMPRESDDYHLQYKKKRRGSPLEDFGGVDPHGIEAKRSRSRPEFTSHFTSIPDYNLPFLEATPEYTFLMDDEFPGPAPLQLVEATMDYGPPVPPVPYNFDDFSSSIVPFEHFTIEEENDPTAQLLCSSLLLSEEKREFESCAFTERNGGGGGC